MSLMIVSFLNATVAFVGASSIPVNCSVCVVHNIGNGITIMLLYWCWCSMLDD